MMELITSGIKPFKFDDELGLAVALKEAQRGRDEGGVPIGSALVYHASDPDRNSPKLLASGHNQRIQKSSAILHGETAALEAAGRLTAETYRKSTMVRNTGEDL